ncbi:hypothetical protein GCM10010383_34830 [Streptomyces lomondensis]|uniref:Uncharacterized protein n=1 Tax=Streptomyces lomondensis TaxID=68229 RepID=A0ABQ2X6A2_9ACTN|nr:hypothetical protein GCM10010383_34830 [Streptomyces lomondensis]
MGGAIAATTLSAGLNQMSEGRPARSTPASGRRRTGGEVEVGRVLLIPARLTGVLPVKHIPPPAVLRRMLPVYIRALACAPHGPGIE